MLKSVLRFNLIIVAVSVIVRADSQSNVTFDEFVDFTFGNFLKLGGGAIGSALTTPTDIVTEVLLKDKCDEGSEPDACRDVPRIIRARGFDVEEHSVITRDGYILTIHRVVNPLIKDRDNLEPVILNHGLLTCSVDWVFASTDVRPVAWPRSKRRRNDDLSLDDRKNPRSLAYYLANEGYDVFLANSRGNTYARQHINKSMFESTFWDFSYDQQIDYDLPDTIDYVRNLTNHKKVAFVGHSQGNTIMFGLMAVRQDYADIVEPFFALAPTVFIHNIKAIDYKIVATLEPFIQNVRSKYLAGKLSRFVLRKMCQLSDCRGIIYRMLGRDPLGVDLKRIQAILHQIPAGTSLRNLVHFLQGSRARNFTRFNYGLAENKLRYGQALPPIYDLSRIRSKSIVLFDSESDILADHMDVELLISSLRVKPYKRYTVSRNTPSGLFNHAHFLYGHLQGVLINRRIVNILNHFREARKKLPSKAPNEGPPSAT